MTDAVRPSDPTRAIARAVLYEGYVLWPYRRSAPKNQRRWTFGGVHPRAWSEDGHPDDAWRMRVECLVERADTADGGAVRVGVRFLHVVERRVARVSEGTMQFADEVVVDRVRRVAWEEAREREVELPPLPLRAGAEIRAPIAFPAACEREWLEDAAGERMGAIVRSWRGLTGEVTVRCEPVVEAEENDGTYRVRVDVSNTTEWSGVDRQEALRSTFASAHVVLRAGGARFASLTDPPAGLDRAAEACRNEGWWPVLVGARGARDTVLASPIILPDYPAVAPESPGDLFDGGEIDELLTLHILALTDEEKEEMRATDPRTREILDRTTALGADALLGLHGAFRDGRTGDPRTGTEGRPGLAEDAPDPFWVEMGREPAGEIVVDGVTLRRGSRVRLHPRPGGDVMDIALAGRTAVVEGIDEDDAGGVHFAVAVEGDPGLDLGMVRTPGHRFFFRPEEVEPLGDEIRDPATGAATEAEPPASPPAPRILVAGIGNIFLGDDGFGVEVARRLSGRPLPEGVVVRDFGIRGMDLAYALRDYETVVLVDAVPRGGAPGTLYVIDAATDPGGPVGVQTHGMDPARVLAFARALGPLPDRVLVLGCEPAVIPDPTADEIVGELSEPVRGAVEGAIDRVERLVVELLEDASNGGSDPP